jgi:agmatine/peptidylarginine deiminase
MKKIRWILILLTSVIALSAQLRMCAEWEPALGTLVRWPLGVPPLLVQELGEDAMVYVLVEDAAQAQQAANAFSYWGVPAAHIEPIVADTYSHWTRDWGPQCGFSTDGEMVIADPVFDGYPWVPGGRGYEEDDVVNAQLAAHLGWDLLSLPAYLTGGNVMYDGQGMAVSTQQMLDENLPLLSNAAFFNLLEDELGIQHYHIVDNFESYGIQHIDCAAKLLDEETMLIKQLPAWHPDYQRMETTAAQLAAIPTCYGRSFEVFRIFCDSFDGNDCAAYTNSLILNTKVLVPVYGIPADDDALAVYETAMPGYEVVGVPYNLWYSYDALHCRTMGVYNPAMLLMRHQKYRGEQSWQPQWPLEVEITDYSGSGIVADSCAVYWQTDGGPWQRESLQSGGGVFTGCIPAASVGSEIAYYVQSANADGVIERLPRTAPDGLYRFSVGEVSAQAPVINEALAVAVYPNPFHIQDATRAVLQVDFTLKKPQTVQVILYDCTGRKVQQQSHLASRQNSLCIPAEKLSTGVYVVQVKAAGQQGAARCVVLR